uniref:YbhB/YbcL family Raf kinase inhibitor-like protein n=1 Tax=Strombidinopsis acuminata TaxID=141414 RepID=A0A7S3TWR6_9SPIT|mmetsp:Transcript_78939/g.109372  ORF Transcript_78939/g.109372 Transcript_78939/m.109372 type:complete len:212 (+) Transcript_78939:2-637(+)
MKESKPSEKKPDFKLSSSSFAHGGEFPTDNRADEDNVNPALSWSGAPKNTESFVLIVDSEGPETGSNGRKTHWIVYDIPKEVDQIRDELSGADASDVGRLGFKEDAGQAPVVVDPMGAIDGWVDPEIERMQQMIHGALDASFKEENRAKEGTTSFGGTRYHGPSIDGTMCIFKLYALSTRLQLPSGASREEIMKAMKGKVLGKTTLSAKVA